MKPNKTLTYVSAAIILIQFSFIGVQQFKLDSRNSRIESLEFKAEYLRKLTNQLRQPTIISSLSDKFHMDVDSTKNQILLTPRVPVSDFFGFVAKWDSVGIISIDEFKP